MSDNIKKLQKEAEALRRQAQGKRGKERDALLLLRKKKLQEMAVVSMALAGPGPAR